MRISGDAEMSKTASLTAGLVARKGQAVPAADTGAGAEPPPVSAPSAAAMYYKALTVKLDRNRYETLKNAGLKLDKKSQEIFVEALDAYLAKIG
jgi:hypothetical protein